MLRKIPKSEMPTYVLIWVSYIGLLAMIGSFGWHTLWIAAVIGLIVLAARQIRQRRKGNGKSNKLSISLKTLLPLNTLPKGYPRLFIFGWVAMVLLATYIGCNAHHGIRFYSRHPLQAIFNYTIPAFVAYYIIGRLAIWVYQGFDKDVQPTPRLPLKGLQGREIIQVVEGSFNDKPDYIKIILHNGKEGIFFKGTLEKEAVNFPENEQGQVCLPTDYWVNSDGLWINLKSQKQEFDLLG